MIVQGNSISECWIKTLIEVRKNKKKELAPLIASYKVDGAPAPYAEELEGEINNYLKSISKPTISTTASTIFPVSLSGKPELLFDRFNKVWPSVKKDALNKYGHYFRRLVAFNESSGEPINQLKHIIETYTGIDGERKPVHRRSALIALTFDPNLDHTSQVMRGFPCLQQVCFIPKKDGTMSLNAIYAMQHLIMRGYGNYIGLKHLGEFMADQMGLRLTEINCIASILDAGATPTNFMDGLVNKYKSYA